MNMKMKSALTIILFMITLYPAFSQPEYFTPRALVTMTGKDLATIHGQKHTVTINTSDLSFSVRDSATLWRFTHPDTSDLEIQVSEKIFHLKLSEAKHKSVTELSTGYKTGVKIELRGYKDFPDAAMNILLSLDGSDEDLTCEIVPFETGNFRIKRCGYPGMIMPGESDFSLLPVMQGMLLPDKWPKNISLWNQEYWNCYSKGMNLPIWGHIRGKSAILALIETPFDAGYRFKHPAGGPTEIGAEWYHSLGKLGYNRIIRFCLIRNGNYVEIAKRYRNYLISNGQFVSLKEKITRSPVLENLIGASVVHTSILHYIKNSSEYFDRKDPAKNNEMSTFQQRAGQIKKLYSKGVRRLYIHLDGWEKRGHDNLYPDILPPCPQAGGWSGMKELSLTCENVGYILALLDNYHDYYMDAPSYDPDRTITNEYGEKPVTSTKFGGEQSVLCGQFIRGYLQRNFDEILRQGIMIRGAYLDACSYVAPDECYNPEHLMNREQCVKYRTDCFSYIISLGMVISSDEAIGWAMPYIDLTHITTYLPDPDNENGTSLALPVPLINLIYHDAVIMPWAYGRVSPGTDRVMQMNDTDFYNGLLNGGIPYIPVDATSEEISRSREMSSLHRRIGLLEMTKHEFLDKNYKIQRTTFADGTTVTVDFNKKSFIIDSTNINR